MPKPTIAITGASGFVGTELVRHFTNKGWRVIALVRQPAAHKPGPSLSYAVYDISKPLDKTVLQDIDYIVHTAYIKQDRQHADALEVNVAGAKRLIEASDTKRLKKRVFISSMSAHKSATSVYALQKLAIEKLFSPKRDVSLRPGLVIGNGGIVKNMAQFMKTKHMVPLVGGGQQPLQIIAVKDLAKAVEQALTLPVRGTFTVATSQVYTYRQFYEALSKRIHTKVLFVPIPLSLLLAVMWLVNFLHLPVSFTGDNVRGLQNLRASDNRKDLEELGLEPGSLTKALDQTEDLQ